MRNAALLLLFLSACSHTSLPVSEELMRLAEQGDAAAQMKVGLAYDNENNQVEAARWYRLAANQGVSEAQNNLGVMYKDGQGVSQDYTEAARWFMKAARQDNILAQLNLGWLYHAGKGVHQDADSAHHWYLLAAEKGLASAQLNLGILYLQQADTVTAIHWLRQAAQQDNAGAQRILNALRRTE
jgi:hypothetical protein